MNEDKILILFTDKEVLGRLPFAYVHALVNCSEVSNFIPASKPRLSFVVCRYPPLSPDPPFLHHSPYKIKETESFSSGVNGALNAKLRALRDAKKEVLRLEQKFEDKEELVESFACCGNVDVISLNVWGTILTTRREMLCAVEDSALARQFDGATWTDQGRGAASVLVT